MIKVDLNIDLQKIPLLPFEELRKYYNALFNLPTTSTRKEYYVWRITYKLQEMRQEFQNALKQYLIITNRPVLWPQKDMPDIVELLHCVV